jgi:hypothetical protein
MGMNSDSALHQKTARSARIFAEAAAAARFDETVTALRHKTHAQLARESSAPSMLVSSQIQSPHVPNLPRTQSSVLAFALREFLNTPGARGPASADTSSYARAPPPPAVPRPPAVTKQQSYPDQSPTASPSVQPENCVWVDCFFYGFWLDKSKVASYQGSLGASAPAGVRA